jgi:hypothetical protein
MYETGWTKLCWPDAPITEGTVVGVLGLHFGLWSLNACRIVYVIEEEEAILFVISLAVSRVAGQTLLVDGGETA